MCAAPDVATLPELAVAGSPTDVPYSSSKNASRSTRSLAHTCLLLPSPKLQHPPRKDYPAFAARILTPDSKNRPTPGSLLPDLGAHPAAASSLVTATPRASGTGNPDIRALPAPNVATGRPDLPVPTSTPPAQVWVKALCKLAHRHGHAVAVKHENATAVQENRIIPRPAHRPWPHISGEDVTPG